MTSPIIHIHLDVSNYISGFPCAIISPTIQIYLDVPNHVFAFPPTVTQPVIHIYLGEPIDPELFLFSVSLVQ